MASVSMLIAGVQRRDEPSQSDSKPPKPNGPLSPRLHVDPEYWRAPGTGSDLYQRSAGFEFTVSQRLADVQKPGEWRVFCAVLQVSHWVTSR